MNPIPRRDIKIKDAIRIDWKRAMSEADNYLESISNSKGILPDDFYKEMIRGVEIVREVKHFYQNDDMNGYLSFLDENKYALKGDNYYG